MRQLILFDTTATPLHPQIRAEHWGCPAQTRQWLPGLQLLTASTDRQAWYGRCLGCGETRRVWANAAAIAEALTQGHAALEATP